jgi:hypothetical protein
MTDVPEGCSSVGSGGTQISGGLWQFDVPACCGGTMGDRGLTLYFNMRGLDASENLVYWVSKDKPGVPAGLIVTKVTCLLMYSSS